MIRDLFILVLLSALISIAALSCNSKAADTQPDSTIIRNDLVKSKLLFRTTITDYTAREYSIQRFAGMDYLIVTGYETGIAITNLTKDSLEVAKLKKE